MINPGNQIHQRSVDNRLIAPEKMVYPKVCKNDKHNGDFPYAIQRLEPGVAEYYWHFRYLQLNLVFNSPEYI